jgi:ligand-binding sensor domain-containing protein
MAASNKMRSPPAVVPNPGAFVSALYKGEGGDIWVGMSTGLVRFRPGVSPPDARFYAASDTLPIDHIGAIEQDVQHNQGKLPERVYSVPDRQPSPIVLRMFRDSRGDIWAGTDDGVGHWSRATGRWQAFRTTNLIPESTRIAAVHSFA